MSVRFKDVLDNPKLDFIDIVSLYLSLKKFDDPSIVIDKEFGDNKFVRCCYDVDNKIYKVELYKDTFYLYDDEHRKSFINFLESFHDFSDLKNIQPKKSTMYAIVHTSIDMYDHTVNNTVDSVCSDKNVAEMKRKELDDAAWRDESIHYFKIVKVPFYK